MLDTGDSGTLTVAQSSKKVGGVQGADGEKYIFSMVASYLQNAGENGTDYQNTIFYRCCKRCCRTRRQPLKPLVLEQAQAKKLKTVLSAEDAKAAAAAHTTSTTF